MGWHADTDFIKTDKGTVLTLMFTPHVDGYEPPLLKAGDKVAVCYATNAREQATVIEASAEAVTIEMQDKSRWNITPRTEADLPFGGVRTIGIPSQDWIVRSKA